MPVPTAVFMVVVAFLLSACSTAGGNFFVTPGKFHLYKCDHLEQQAQYYIFREKELRGLIEQANNSPGGGVISNIAYGTEYAQAQGSIDELRREVTEKKCSPPPPGLMPVTTMR